jgi:transcriptional regulator with XRE-family HTH domain
VNKPSKVLHRFGAKVREARRVKGISQEAFADLCGLDRTYISGIERGKRNVGLRNIALIAQALGLTISQLTEGV